MYRIGFILEQALGHVTHSQNLQLNVPRDPAVIPYWGLPSWKAGGWTGKVPVVKSNWTLRAGFQARSSLAEMHRQTKMDALFFHTQVPAVLAQDWIRKIPSIVSLDATPLQYDALGSFYAHAAGPDWFEKWKWRLNRDCFRLARGLVVWSEWTAKGLIDGYEVPAEKITVIPPGVNTRAWERPVPRGLHSGPVKILFVGSSLERKGGWLLLEAFRRLKQLVPAGNPMNGSEQERGIELHLVTKDILPPEPGLTVYNHMEPNSPALKQLYFDCDIFCLPTQGDCLPMVLSEAGSAGLPSISTRVAAIPEIVQDGETGFLIDPGDLDQLTDALQRLIADEELRLRMGERAVEIIRQRFDAEQNTYRLLDLVKRMIEDERSRGGSHE